MVILQDEAGEFFRIWPGRLAARVDPDDLIRYWNLEYLRPQDGAFGALAGDEFELLHVGLDCATCDGTRRIEVLDRRRVTPVSINQPTKMIDCPDCMGTGFGWEFARRLVSRAEIEAITEEGLP